MPMDESSVSMDCAAFEKISHQLYRPDPAETSLAEAAMAHAESCSRCAALLTEVEWLEYSLLDLARHDANSRVSPRVESALVQEFRRQKTAVARRQLRWRLAALGVAAAFILFVGLSFYLHVWRLPPSSFAPLPSDAGAAHSQPAPAASQVQSSNLAVAAAPVTEPQSTADNSSDTEDAAFVPLPYADESATDDGGAIVRVRLSRPELASFGIPVDDFSGDEQIQADLLVGVDGTPEAIRLVSQLGPGE